MKAKKKVAIVGIVGLPANYGGFETMVNYLTLLKNQEYDFTVFCQKTAKEKQLRVFNGCRLKYLPFKANGSQSIIYDIYALILSWFKYDVILILGTPGAIALPFLRLFKNTKTIINFGGLEWKRDKWIKPIRRYLKLTEKVAVKNASVFIADNEYFCEYIKDKYNKECHLIEYGGDHTLNIKPTVELKKKYKFLSESYYISVSRAQADNNLHILLEAFSKTPKKNLVLISNWNKFDYGIQLKNKYAKYNNIYTIDEIYDLFILDTLRSNAEVYIHSHTYCGTAPSLVEAMNLGLPVISFEANANIKTTENKAKFFTTSDDLIKVIDSLSSAEIVDLGNKMKEIAKRRYTWQIICEKYSQQIN